MAKQYPLTCDIATVLCGGPGLQLPVDADECPPDGITIHNEDNHLTPCQAYNQILEYRTPCYSNSESLPRPSDVIIYIHDDVTIHEHKWVRRIFDIFWSRPQCVCVGLGGATSLGRDELYKRPYRITDMARGGYASNQTDWDIHGGREVGEKQVAVVDAFFMAIRRSFLEEAGGWPEKYLTHHCLDLWVACEAARQKKQVWMLGVKCTHHGGGTSTKKKYREASWLQGGSLEEDHRQPHKWLYEEYRDVLPIKIQGTV